MVKVLVTAGGTKVKIDDVRHLANFSKGKFGFEIARQFAYAGADVHLLGSEELLDRERLGLSQLTLRRTAFKYYEDFRDSLFRIIVAEKPDIVIMAAAVSDWLCADARGGKIESNQEELVLRFTRAPKIIGELRERCGKTTFLVGFKLLSGAPHAELMEKAHRQVRENRLNLTVANDLSQISETSHPVTLVTPEGGEVSLDEGPRQNSARGIADFILRRQRVTWSRSVSLGSELPFAQKSSAYANAVWLNEFAKMASLYGGTDGNLSWRASSDGDMFVSPRQVQKAEMTADDLVYARERDGKVEYQGRRKPSIDTAVQAALYRALPLVHGLLHVHEDAGIVLPEDITSFPYPCGCREEAEEILATLEPDVSARSTFALELLYHGFLIGLEEHGCGRLLKEWEIAITAYHRHLQEIGHEEMSIVLKLQPIFNSSKIVGVLATHPLEKWASAFLLPEHRERGCGGRILKAMARRGLTIKAHDLCKVRAYYEKHGWKVVSVDGPTALIAPPVKE